MKEPRLYQDDTTGCPKRVWVMTVLSDDEALSDADELPRGLQFHLSRCESCRVLADRILAVSAMLRGLSQLEPDAGLGSGADAQALAALREGARLTGRVSIPEEPEQEPAGFGPPGADSRGAGARLLRHRYGALAAAAAIVLVVGLFAAGRAHWRTPPSGGASDHLLAHDVAPSSGSHPTATTVARNDTMKPAGSDSDGRAEVGAVATVAARKRPSRSVCRHRSPLEAAMCDNAHALHRVVTLPGRRRPHAPPPPGVREDPHGTMEAFDNSPSGRSTGRRKTNERSTVPRP